MKRLSLRRFLKATILALATSMIIIPSALSMPLVVAGGSGAAQARSPGPRDGWNTPVSAAPSSGPVDNVFGRAIEPRILDAAATEGFYTGAPEPLATSDSSPGRIIPDVSPVSVSAPVLDQPRGFDWSDAGLGAAGGFALTALLAAMALLAVRHRRLPLAHN
jgi:hypothetical protein